MLNALNFTNLTAEGYAAFILALIFTIVTIASAIFVARHKKLSTVLIVVTVLVVPMITVFCWIYLLLTVLEQSLVNCLCIALACAIGYGIVALSIGLIVNAVKGKEEVEEVSETENQEEVHEETEKVEETPAVAPLLIEVENKETEATEQPEEVEEVMVESVETEEPATEEVENVAEVETEQAQEETTETEENDAQEVVAETEATVETEEPGAEEVEVVEIEENNDEE